MHSNEKLKKTIQAISFPVEWKPRIDRVVLKAGSYALAFLYDELATVGSELTLKYLVPAMEEALEATETLGQGQEDPWIQLATVKSQIRDSDFGRYYVAPLLDARRLEQSAGISLELLRVWTALELQYPNDLPPEEYVDINERNLLMAMDVSEYLSILKKYYFERIPKRSLWPAQMSRALTLNEEKIGTKPFMSGQRQMAPTIKNWLGDFMTNAIKIQTGSSAFEGIHYLSQSPGAGSLPTHDQKKLLSVIKIYLWCSHPQVNPKEFENYSPRVANEAMAVLAPQAARANFPPVPLKYPKTGGVDIDRKLEELKRKAGE